jgi:hypothetical protein
MRLQKDFGPVRHAGYYSSAQTSHHTEAIPFERTLCPYYVTSSSLDVYEQG